MCDINDKQLQKLYQRIKTWLETEDFKGFTDKDLFIMQFIKKGWGQDVAALSNMSEALFNIASSQPQMKDEIKPLMQSAIARARHKKVSPYKKDPADVKNLDHYGYYLEHLNVMLGLYQSLYDDQYLPLNRRISEYLRDESLSQDNAHARLIPHIKMRWSADQAAILHSLTLFDRNNGTQLAQEPVEKWLDTMHRHMRDEKTGLFQTEVMRVKEYSEQPRGCSLAYMIHYMASFAPDIAEDQWQRLQHHMSVSAVGLYGFREYLPDYDGGWTPDSGPIIAGVGIAATGLGLKTAATLQDYATYKRLKRAIQTGISLLDKLDVIPGIGKLSRIGTDLLASSIYLSALSRTLPEPETVHSEDFLSFVN